MKTLFHSTIATLLVVSCFGAERAEGRSFDSNGVRIHYVVKGEGQPVVLIHGITQSAEVTWGSAGVIDALAREYRVVALDCRGHGASGKPHDPHAYGAEMVEDVVRLLDHLEIDRAHVVGFSMGGRIALRLAESHPDRVRSTVLVGSGGMREGEDLALMDALARSLVCRGSIRPLLDEIFASAPVAPPEAQLVELDRQIVARNDPEALACVVRGYRQWTVRDAELRANRVPTLAIVGTADLFKESVLKLDGTMGSLRIRILDGAGHADVVARPELLQAVRTFLAQSGA